MHVKITKINFSNFGSAFVKRVRKIYFCNLGNSLFCFAIAISLSIPQKDSLRISNTISKK